jgi:hypothetical protein
VTTADETNLEALRAKHPDWNIWYVPHVVGPTVWCCKPKDLPHHEDSAEALDKWLEAQQS